MFCESTLWSIGDEHLQTTREPICLVEITSGRSVYNEDMNGEGWISENHMALKQDHKIISKPQTTARSRIVHFLKFWTFLQFKTSTRAWYGTSDPVSKRLLTRTCTLNIATYVKISQKVCIFIILSSEKMWIIFIMEKKYLFYMLRTL